MILIISNLIWIIISVLLMYLTRQQYKEIDYFKNNRLYFESSAYFEGYNKGKGEYESKLDELKTDFNDLLEREKEVLDIQSRTLDNSYRIEQDNKDYRLQIGILAGEVNGLLSEIQELESSNEDLRKMLGDRELELSDQIDGEQQLIEVLEGILKSHKQEAGI